MINKFSLSFTQPKLEQSFISERHIQHLQEFDAFLTMCGVLIIRYKIIIIGKIIIAICMAQQILMITVIIGFILLCIFRYLIRHKPTMLQLLLIIIQIVLCLLYNYNQIVGDHAAMVVSIQTRWYIGFEAATIHTCTIYIQTRDVYLQGTNFIKQTLAMIGVFLLYLVFGSYSGTEIVVTQVSFFLLIFGIVMMRYRFEFYKRTQYLDLSQNTKWMTVIDEILSQWIILVRYCEESQQIQIVKCNQSFRRTMSINDDADFRQLIRGLKIYEREQQQQDVKFTRKMNYNLEFEQIIRTKLFNLYGEIEHDTFQKYNLFHQETNRYFKASVMDYYHNQEKLVLLSIQENKQKELIQHLRQAKAFNLEILQNVVQDAILNINHLLQHTNNRYPKHPSSTTLISQRKQSNSLILTESFWNILHFQNLSQWMIHSIKPVFNQINNSAILKMISSLVPIQIEIINSISFHSDASRLQKIILNTVYLLKYSFNLNTEDIMLEIEQTLSDLVVFQFRIKNDHHLSKSVTKYLQSPIYYKNNIQEHLTNSMNNQLIQKELNQVIKFFKYRQNTDNLKQINATFSLVMLKYHLTHFATTNAISYVKNKLNHQHTLSFTLLNLQMISHDQILEQDDYSQQISRNISVFRSNEISQFLK